MKNLSLPSVKSVIMFAFMLLVYSSYFSMNAFAGNKNQRNTADINVIIPDQWKSNIAREDNGGVSTFSLVNGNTTPVFLFSVTEISEHEWVKVKAQLPDVKMFAHKNGNIYFIDKNQKEKIKGASSELYAQIYPFLDQIINSIQIN